jgi:hypothetical protein
VLPAHKALDFTAPSVTLTGLFHPKHRPHGSAAGYSPHTSHVTVRRAGEDPIGKMRLWGPQQETTMKRIFLFAAAALLLTTFVPEQADAQGMRRGGYGGGAVRRGMAVRPGVRYYGGRRGYAYRGGYRRGWGAPAIGLGILGAAAVGAAAAGSYGYVDPCLRQQQVVDPWGNVGWQTVRVC